MRGTDDSFEVNRSFLGGERKIALWVPDWSVAALAAGIPPGSPAATVKNGVVYECTRAARMFGIRQGMRQVTAEHVCPDLLVTAYDPLKEAADFESVLQVFDRVVAGVVAIRPGLAWAAVPSNRWGVDEEMLARDLAEQCALETGIEAFIGIGDGAASAVAAARRGIIIPKGKGANFLESLPLVELTNFLPKDATLLFQEAFRILKLLGIRRVSEIWKLGSGQLVTRFGGVGKQIWELAIGADLHVSPKEESINQERVRHEFSPPVSGVEHAMVGARTVAQKLVDTLLSKGCSAQSLTIWLHFSDGTETTRRWSLFDLSQSSLVAQRVIWQIQNWQNSRDNREEADEFEKELYLDAITLEANDLVLGGTPGLLWGDRPQLAKVGQTVAQLQTLLGEEAVKQPQLQGGMDPRGRTELQPWGFSEAGLPSAGEWAGSVQEAPLLLFDKPPLAKVMGQQKDSTWGQISVDRRGMLSGTPTRVAVLEDRPDLPAGGYAVGGVEGVWAVKNTWWKPDQDSSRCYLRLRMPGRVDFLLVQKGGEWAVEGMYVQQGIQQVDS